MPRLSRLSFLLAALLASGCGDGSANSAQGVEKGVYGDKTADASGGTPATIEQGSEDTSDGETPAAGTDTPEAPAPPVETPIVSAPEPAPPVAPPPPSGDIVNRDDHVAFARAFLNQQTFNDVQGLMGLYADRVRYFNRGTVARSAVATDKSNYFERWPNRFYEISGPVRATRGANPTIRFDYDFAVSDANASGEREGRAWVELRLSPGAGGYVISGERGGTY